MRRRGFPFLPNQRDNLIFDGDFGDDDDMPGVHPSVIDWATMVGHDMNCGGILKLVGVRDFPSETLYQMQCPRCGETLDVGIGAMHRYRTLHPEEPQA